MRKCGGRPCFATAGAGETARSGFDAGPAESPARRLRSACPRGLLRQSDVRRWAADNDIDAGHFERMMADEAPIEKLARLRTPNCGPRCSIAFANGQLSCPARPRAGQAKMRASGAAHASVAFRGSC